MTTGALIFAINTEIDYLSLAQISAARVKKYLDIPVTLVTDCSVDLDVFDDVICLDSKGTQSTRYWADRKTKSQWFNATRCQALDISHYDRTLLIDADYMIATDRLKSLLEFKQGFYAHRTVMDIVDSLPCVSKFGNRSVDLWWATVCVFDRSEFSKDVFFTWKMIQENYNHYATLFDFEYSPFRNDYALSLALLLTNGHEMPSFCEIPWPLINVAPQHNIVQLQSNSWEIEYQLWKDNQNSHKRISVRDQDLHVMGKKNLENINE